MTTRITTVTTIISERITTTATTTPVLSAGATGTLDGVVVIKSFPALVVGEFVCGISFELSVSVVLSVVEGGSVEEGGVVPIVVGLVGGGSVVGRGTV